MFCIQYKNKIKTQNSIIQSLRDRNDNLLNENEQLLKERRVMHSQYKKMMEKYEEWREISLLAENVKNVPMFESNIHKIKFIIKNYKQ